MSKAKTSMPEVIHLVNCEGETLSKWYINSWAAAKWAIRKFTLPETIGVMAYIRSDLANDFVKIKNLELELERERAKNKKLKSAIEFYANPKTWIWTTITKGTEWRHWGLTNKDKDDVFVDGKGFAFIGEKRARQTLKEIEATR